MNADIVGQLTGASTVAHEVPEGHAVWSAWHFDLPVVIPALLLGFFYARGLYRWRERNRQHPWWRTALYYLGLSTLVLSIVSPIDSLGSHHFSMHMVQHELIMLVGVPLILLGAPTTPVLRGMPKWLRLGVVAGLAGDSVVRFVWRFLTQPLIALTLYTVVLIAWHMVPGWYDAAVRHEGIHFLQHFTFAGTAFLFWWNVIDPAPLQSSMGFLVRMLYVVAAGTAQSVVAAMLTLGDRVIYDVYLEARPIFGISPLADQELGGLIMWIPGQMLHLVAIGLLFGVWAVQSERRQREFEERELAAAQ